ncbi:hypothetical protein EBZ39_13940 [bacterium]|nr:hypothetical protein [bacterium]
MKIEPVSIEGNGSSLWCEDSRGEFVVKEMSVRNCHGTDEPYELVLRGPKTRWGHYTDDAIEENVNRVFVPLVQKEYPRHTIVRITWSEQGMQPYDGWSFDIHSKENI